MRTILMNDDKKVLKKVNPAITRFVNAPRPITLKIWTIQPLYVWESLVQEKELFVDPSHPDFYGKSDIYSLEAYNWLCKQMASRVCNYTGCYPWWAYTHFLDLRFYRYWHSPHGCRRVRLELAIERDRLLLSNQRSWVSVMNRAYIETNIYGEPDEEELRLWEEGVDGGVQRRGYSLYDEPWESQMRSTWERIFDVEQRFPTEVTQANFERLRLDDVVKATFFDSAGNF